MLFSKALEELRKGNRIKLPSWGGYWELENGNVMIVLNDAGTLLISAQKEGTNLVPPACVANVEGLSNAMIGVMVGVVGFVIVLAIGVALFIVLRTVTST